MKRSIFSCLVFLLGFLPIAFAEDGEIAVIKVFDNVSMLVNTTNTAAAIDLNGYKPGNFTYSLQLACTNCDTTNAGIAQVLYQVSNDGAEWLLSSNIVADITYTNSASGKGFYVFSTGICKFLRIQARSTITNLYLNGWLAIQ